MAWVKIDDGFARHPKIMKAGPLAMAMQVAALCYCNQNLTDGFVPRAAARTLLDWEVVGKDGRIETLGRTCGHAGNDVTSDWVIGLLVDAGMWIEEPGGFRIHDYLDYQPSADDIRSEREKTKKRVNQWRSKKKRGSNDVTNAVSNGEGNAECNDGRNGGGNGVSNGPVTPAPVPVPKTLTSDSSLRSESAVVPAKRGDPAEREADSEDDPLTIPPFLRRNDNNQVPEPAETTQPAPAAVPAKRTAPQPVTQAFEEYNATAARLKLPIATKLTEDRRKRLRKRLEEHGMDGWRKALDNLGKISFLRGDNDRGWTADFDFLLQPKSLNRVIEGGYGRGTGPPNGGGAGAALAELRKMRGEE